MKRTFPANINGRVYYIDEDAYSLLSTYLEQLRKAFPNQEGEEIIADIEARISEIFSELTSGNDGVITIANVNAVIEQMGRPSDLGAAEDTPQSGETTPPPFENPAFQPDQPVQKRLYRNEQNKVFGGVLSGIAVYLGWNVTILRILIIILALSTQIWPLFVIYLLAWLIIPAARTPRQILEMRGRPVTVETVGRTVMGTPEPDDDLHAGNPIQTAFSVFGKIALTLLGVVGGAVGVGFIILLICALCALVIYAGWGSLEVIDIFPSQYVRISPVLGLLGLITLSLACIIPAIAAVWGACCALFNSKTPSRNLVISTLVLEIILVVASIILFAFTSPIHFHHTSMCITTVAASFLPLHIF